jgi:hypothetical protein
MIQAPENLQSWNAYTYVFNNPLTLVDPTGMFAWRSFLSAFGQVLNIVSYFIPILRPFAIAFNIIMAAAGGGIKAGLLAAFGSMIPGLDNIAANIAVGALYGGVSAMVMGGKFKEGVVGALKSAAVGMVMRAIAQGVKSQQTGGKFKNGADTDSSSETLATGNSKTPADPKKAAQLMRDAKKALKDSGFYKKVAAGSFRSEREIAQAWAEIVGPLANAAGAEAGAWISILPNGAYAIGEVYSDGARENVEPGKAMQLKGYKPTAFVHTHPFVDGGQYLSNQYGVGGLDDFGDVVHPNQGDMSWAIGSGKNIYSYGGPSPILRGFNPVTWEAGQTVGKLQKMCLYTTPLGCP